VWIRDTEVLLGRGAMCWYTFLDGCDGHVYCANEAWGHLFRSAIVEIFALARSAVAELLD